MVEDSLRSNVYGGTDLTIVPHVDGVMGLELKMVKKNAIMTSRFPKRGILIIGSLGCVKNVD